MIMSGCNIEYVLITCFLSVIVTPLLCAFMVTRCDEDIDRLGTNEMVAYIVLTWSHCGRQSSSRKLVKVAATWFVYRNHK